MTVAPIYNPYAKNNRHALSAGNHGSRIAASHGSNNQPRTFLEIMGCQSQMREGSIKKCRKKATKAKYKRNLVQAAVTGGRAFDATNDCRICRAKLKAKQLKRLGVILRIPHRSHDPRCGKNIETRAMSKRWVEVNKTVAENLATNNEPLEHGLLATGTTAAQKAAALGFFQNLQNEKTNDGNEKTEAPKSLGGFFDAEMVETTLGTYLCQELERRIVGAKRGSADVEATSAEATSGETITTEATSVENTSGSDYGWLKDCSAPKCTALLMDYILQQFEHRRPKTGELPATESFLSARERYHTFFSPGTCIFTFPHCYDKPSSPNYHSLEGQSVFVLDWQLSHPEVELCCYDCKTPTLKHDRTNFSKNHNLFPVWLPCGTAMWGAVMNYDCTTCGARFAANDGKLLSLLSAHVRAAYPVEPRYATGAFHFHKQATDELEPIMKTYGNGNFYCKKLYRTMGVEYQRKLETYLSDSPTTAYVAVEDWIGGNYPPSGHSIRACYERAELSQLTPYGISNVERYEREIQSVRVAVLIAIDWTFQVVKNYILPGAKACFTMCTETGEIAALGIVESTASSQISHMLQQLVQNRPEFRPKVIYTDTWPNGEKFWKNIFGFLILGRLGFFHLIKRILDTLNSNCERYWEALVELKAVFYRYHDEDETKLLRVLKDGSFARDGKHYTDGEIRELKHSKRWKQRFHAFLRKIFYPVDTARYRLQTWVDKFRGTKDSQGQCLFSRDTEKAANEQSRKAQHIQDPPGIEMYSEVPPGPRTTHGLSRHLSLRPESTLEKFHEALAHFGNTGTGSTLMDGLNLRGASELNVVRRHILKLQELRRKGLTSGIPQYLEDVPLFFNHSMLQYLNCMAELRGLAKIFPGVHHLQPNNGEQFLSKYFVAQQERNRLHGQDKTSGKCLCPSCRTNPFPLVETEIQTIFQSTTATAEIPRTMVAPVDAPRPSAVHEISRIAPMPRSILPTVRTEMPSQTNAFIPVPPPVTPRMPFNLPQNRCFEFYPFYCSKFADYLIRKHQNGGGGIYGRKPHDTNCPCNPSQKGKTGQRLRN
jgi:hypothetical protein